MQRKELTKTFMLISVSIIYIQIFQRFRGKKLHKTSVSKGCPLLVYQRCQVGWVSGHYLVRNVRNYIRSQIPLNYNKCVFNRTFYIIKISRTFVFNFLFLVSV